MDALINETPLPEQIQLNDTDPFPLVLTPKGDGVKTLADTVSFIETHRDEILARLLRSGAILFRGFPVPDAMAFDEFARAFKWPTLPYVGGAAPRSQVTSIVFTSNESPPSQPIPFHHEMAQVPKFPEHIMFFCEKPAKSGGETPIAFSPMVYERIQQALPEFVDALEKKQVRYTRVLPNGDDATSPIGRGWQSTYLTQDREHAEKVCREQGTGKALSLSMFPMHLLPFLLTDAEWLDDGCLKTTTKILPAVRLDERTGRIRPSAFLQNTLSLNSQERNPGSTPSLPPIWAGPMTATTASGPLPSPTEN